MSYQVLARKWRPRKFSEIVGQELILRMLTNALDNQRLHHAYLFTGTRGVGKTTLARIFAKCLNCEKGISATPCDECATCKAIDSGRFLDLIEVDAASKTKVEDTRELLENVQYAPNQGRFKVYIIDEVHMLSGHSFNALLKTLEEPPPHVKFLLATTDPKRLPITVLSRCLQFNLKRMVPENIATHLQHLLSEEKIPYEAPALLQLANAADGSMRDALSLLDQAIAFCGGNITEATVNQMLGNVEQNYIWRLLQSLAEQNAQLTLAIINELAEYGPDFNKVLEDLLSALHHIAVAQATGDTSTLPDALAALVTQFSKEETQLYYQMALISRRDLALAPNPRVGFEMALLRMLAFKPVGTNDIPTPAKKSLTPPKLEKPAPATTTPAVNTAPLNINNEEWSTLLTKLDLSGMAYALAANCSLQKITATTVELALSPSHKPMLHATTQERIQQAFQTYYGKPITLTINIADAPLQTTPTHHQQKQQQAAQTAAVQTILEDPFAKKIMQTFDAEVDESSITTS